MLRYNIPDVSILVPAYNVCEYIEECINSLLCQTLKNIEIVVVDDGSTDGTGEILDRYASRDNRIIVIHQENSGYGHAMNTALDISKGKYVGILESDDCCRPEMFEYLYKLCNMYNLDIAKSNYYLWWPKTKNTTKYVQISYDCLYDKVIAPHNSPEILFCPPSIWSSLYKKDIFIRNNIRFTETPGASYQDTAFNMKVWCSVDKVWLCREAFVYYRQDNLNSSVNNKEKVYYVCSEYDEATQFARKNKSILLPYVQKMRYSAYLWNYDRISKKFKSEFLSRMRDDFKQMIENGEFLDSLYSFKERIKINIIMNFPLLFQIKKLWR